MTDSERIDQLQALLRRLQLQFAALHLAYIVHLGRTLKSPTELEAYLADLKDLGGDEIAVDELCKLIRGSLISVRPPE